MQTLLSSLVSRVYSGCAYAAFVAASFWGVLFLADVGPLPHRGLEQLRGNRMGSA